MTLVVMGESWTSFAQATAPAPAAAAGKPQGATPSLSFFVPLLLVCGVFYIMLIRPQQKQAKERQLMISAIQKGDSVITTGGIYGRITGIADSILTLEIADNCKIKIERSGIQTVVNSSKEGSSS